jgi:hypothetical protein
VLPVVLFEPLGDAGGEVVEDEIIGIQANSTAQFGELIAKEPVPFDDPARTRDQDVGHRRGAAKPVPYLPYGELRITVMGLDVLAGDVRDELLVAVGLLVKN